MLWLILSLLLAVAVSSTENLDNIHHLKVLEKLSNKEIVFMGDSLSRYQYLNFIGFLHTAQWVSRPPHIESERAWADTVDGDWARFTKMSNLRFGGYEICDCYRDPGNPIPVQYTPEQSFENWIPGMKENRHYFDPAYNISIKFFFYTGFPFLMGKIPDRIDFQDMDQSLDRWLFNNYSATYEHRYDHLDEFLSEQIKPRYPDILLFNMGAWDKSPELKNFNNDPKPFADLLKASAKVPIWKTTTAHAHDVTNEEPEEHSRRDNPATLEALKSENILVFDAYKFSRPFSFEYEANYDDYQHFKAHVYAVLNKHLILMLETIL